MADKLVLWKPLGQRVAESLISPLVVLPVGPVLRMFLGNGYTPAIGFFAVLLLMYLTTLGGRFWARSHGGEWVTAAERLQRLLDETGLIPRWKVALLRLGTYIPLIVGMVLVVQPADAFGTGFGGPAVAAGLILLLSFVGIIPILTGQQKRTAASLVIERNEVPIGQVLAESFRLVPRSYLATLIATVAGFFAGLRIDASVRLAVFIVVTLVGQQFLRQLPFFNKLPKRVHASFGTVGFWIAILYGIVSWGVPFSIMFTGGILVMETGLTVPIVAGIGFMIAVAIAFGAFMGIWVYLINRVGQRRATRSQT